MWCCLQVSARLPPPVQVLNATLAHSRRGERDGVMQQALAGGAGDVPGTSLDALGAAAHQLIDDMEDQQVRVGGQLPRVVQTTAHEGVFAAVCVCASRLKRHTGSVELHISALLQQCTHPPLCHPQVVADRVLLARLVLVREELRALAERQASQSFWHPDGSVTDTPAAAAAPASAAPPAAAADGASSSGSSQPFFAFHRSNLPARCAAFLKNLLSVSARDQRLGLLAKVRALQLEVSGRTTAAEGLDWCRSVLLTMCVSLAPAVRS